MKKILKIDVDEHLNRSDVLINALQHIVMQREYYLDLHQDDIEHNINHLFDELSTIRSMMFDENGDVRDTLLEE